jgi:hypothetical protein
MNGIAIGTGATCHVGSDRYPYTVISMLTVRNKLAIVVRPDVYTRTDKNLIGGQQEYVYAPGEAFCDTLLFQYGEVWRENPKGTPFVVGEREAYLDPHF